MSVHTHQQKGETFAGYTTLETKACPSCGVLYAAPQRLFEVHWEKGESWYCPNGHSVVFVKSKQDELEAERERVKREAARAGRFAAERDQLQASLSAQRSATTRIKNQRDHERKRTAAGVCPCCSRSFKQLRRHMNSQHPDFPHEVSA